MNLLDCDVAILGAGAGLTAAGVLARAGKTVRCLEATDRAGGRILTVHDPLAQVPIELGAEFIHGLPPQIWSLLRNVGLTAYEHTARVLHVDGGRFLEEKEVGEIADHVLAQLSKSAKRTDESFDDVLGRSHLPPNVKNWARAHIEGFNAARKELISVASLKRDTKAAGEIDGDRAFRILGGYDSLIRFLIRSIPEQQPVPLGVLQARGAIHFQPEPKGIQEAARKLEFGQVYRVTFRFEEAFWETDERLKGMGFLISREKQFPTWWTNHPIVSPLLTGWSAGPAADPFLGAERPVIISEALASLARILGRKIPRPLAAYFHDWHADPFFRGAYSYTPVNALSAHRTLSKPFNNTLFFAGEATDTTGHGGTVHGAIASGMRAAMQVQERG